MIDKIMAEFDEKFLPIIEDPAHLRGYMENDYTNKVKAFLRKALEEEEKEHAREIVKINSYKGQHLATMLEAQEKRLRLSEEEVANALYSYGTDQMTKEYCKLLVEEIIALQGAKI